MLQRSEHCIVLSPPIRVNPIGPVSLLAKRPPPGKLINLKLCGRDGRNNYIFQEIMSFFFLRILPNLQTVAYRTLACSSFKSLCFSES